jgi:cell wall-associated NlpC family hydrolase
MVNTGSRRLLSVPIAVAGAGLAVIFGIALITAGSGALTPAPAGATADCAAAPVPPGSINGGPSLDPSQIANAQIIYNVSLTLQLPPRAATIALAAALQESGLRNLSTGRGGSLGLFQQRPSQGWGTPQQIMNPVHAAAAFYVRLTEIPGWQALPLTAAAQAVQHSGHPAAYARWQPLVTALTAAFSAPSACAGDSAVPASGTTRLPPGFTLPPGTPLAIQQTIAYALAQLGKPYIWGGTGPAGYDCSGLVMMAYQTAGITIPRTTYQQVLTGAPVYSISQLQPGDLLFTPGSDGTPADPGHVGMYIGSGLVIQAPQTGEDIMLTPVTGYWQQKTVAIRRIVSPV